MTQIKGFKDFYLLTESVVSKGFKIIPEGSSLPTSGIVKFGVDPTGPDLHLGHLIPILMVKKLKEQGMTVQIVLGTYTAMLGDPSGKDQTRQMLSSSQTKANADKLISQLERILGKDININFNNEWFDKMTMTDLLQILSKYTVDYLMSRDAFQKRQESGATIGMHELIVPLLQGLDSVELKANVEVGGSDQLFNFLLSREVQTKAGQEPEICVMAPIINGTDGRKMSKTFGNCIYVNDPSKDVFGKVMSISDDTMREWYPLFVESYDTKEHPMKLKKALAVHITNIIWPGKGEDELKGFESQFQKGVLPDNIPVYPKSDIVSFVSTMTKGSKSATRTLLQQGAVTVIRDGSDQKVNDMTFQLNSGDIVKSGKRNYGKVE